MGPLLVVHVIVCVLLIGVVLLQVGRGASAGPSFGGGGGGKTLFGPSGRASFLGKVIVVLAIIFAVTTLVLSVLSGGGSPPG